MAVVHDHPAADRVIALRQDAERRRDAAQRLIGKLTAAMEGATIAHRARLIHQVRAARQQSLDAAAEAERYARQAQALRRRPSR